MAQRSVNNARTQRKMRGESVKTEKGETSQEFYTGKRSAAGGKPARAAAAGVYVAPSGKGKSKSKATPGRELTKEEKRLERAERRSEEDRKDIVVAYLMRQDPSYVKLRRTWWILLGVGFACILVSFFLQFVIRSTSNETMAVVALVFLVLSYLCIIGAVIYDLFIINKKRKAVRAQVDGMSEKRINRLLEQNRAERQAEIDTEGDGLVAKAKRFFRT